MAAPVWFDESSRCAPSVPWITVAVMPGLSVAELIAAATSATVLLVASIVKLKLLLPSCRFSVPVPTVAVLPPTNAFDRSCCAEASAETVIA